MSSPLPSNRSNQGVPSGGAVGHNPSVTSPSPTSNPSSTASPPKADPFASLDDLVDAFLSGPSARSQQNLPPLLRPPPLINEDPLQCLRTLVERRAWGDVLQVTTELLRGADSIHAVCYGSLLVSENADDATSTEAIQAETVEIMALYCHALIKLRRYAELGKEVEKWMFLSFNEGYKDCESHVWVPWSLHIIAAETFLYTTEDPNRGADALYAIVDRISESDDIRWKLSAYRALSNAFSRKREWRMAISSLDRMLPDLEKAVLQEVGNIPIHAQKVLETAYRAEVMSTQGRYLLHAGAVAEASYVFQVAENEWNRIQQEAGGAAEADLEGNIVVEHIPAQLFVNEGLLCFAFTNYDQAIECFKNAVDHLRKYSVSPKYLSNDWVGPNVVGVTPHWTLLNECVNNLSICALYTGRLAEATNLLECLVREDPTAFFTERVAFNLCTMYELGCDSTASATKKRVLQLIAKRWFLHDVGPESFRLG